ncbi:MAG: hypothetical protein ACKO24_04990 [Leptolyngbyaceae cyanobacterium]
MGTDPETWPDADETVEVEGVEIGRGRLTRWSGFHFQKSPKREIDSPLPWQSPRDKLSPGRVAQAFPVILAAIGTPAQAPKPRRKSPGRAQGHQPSPPLRYPTVKKHASKRKKSEKSPKQSEPIAV